MLSLKLQPKPGAIPLFRRLTACATTRRHLTISPALLGKQMPPRPSVNEEEIEESFLKGSGPGGQKSESKNFVIPFPELPETQTHSPETSCLVVKSQATRSRSQNRKIARKILAEKLEFMERGEESRVGVIAERDRKRKQSKTKKAKRKYSKLDSEKRATDEEEGEGEGEKGKECGNGGVEAEEDGKPRAKAEEITPNEQDTTTTAEVVGEVGSDKASVSRER